MKILRNIAGVSLLQVMMFGGVMSGVAVVSVNQMKTAKKSLKTVDKKSKTYGVKKAIFAYLNSRRRCLEEFSGLILDNSGNFNLTALNMSNMRDNIISKGKLLESTLNMSVELDSLRPITPAPNSNDAPPDNLEIADGTIVHRAGYINLSISHNQTGGPRKFFGGVGVGKDSKKAFRINLAFEFMRNNNNNRWDLHSCYPIPDGNETSLAEACTTVMGGGKANPSGTACAFEDDLNNFGTLDEQICNVEDAIRERQPAKMMTGDDTGPFQWKHYSNQFCRNREMAVCYLNNGKMVGHDPEVLHPEYLGRHGSSWFSTECDPTDKPKCLSGMVAYHKYNTMKRVIELLGLMGEKSANLDQAEHNLQKNRDNNFFVKLGFLGGCGDDRKVTLYKRCLNGKWEASHFVLYYQKLRCKISGCRCKWRHDRNIYVEDESVVAETMLTGIKKINSGALCYNLNSEVIPCDQENTGDKLSIADFEYALGQLQTFVNNLNNFQDFYNGVAQAEKDELNDPGVNPQGASSDLIDEYNEKTEMVWRNKELALWNDLVGRIEAIKPPPFPESFREHFKRNFYLKQEADQWKSKVKFATLNETYFKAENASRSKEMVLFSTMQGNIALATDINNHLNRIKLSNGYEEVMMFVSTSQKQNYTGIWETKKAALSTPPAP